MGNQRHAKEQVDELDLSVVTFTLDRRGKILISNVHDRAGSILSDRRTGVERYHARYSALLTDKEYYPVSKEAGTSTEHVISHHVLDAVAPVADVIPIDDDLVNLQLIRAVCTVFAVNRALEVNIYDGTGNVVPIYRSGAGGLAGGEDGIIFPTDELTAVPTYPGSRNSFDYHSTSWLRFTAIGLAAAEEIAIDIHQIHHDAGGLRE